MYKFSDPKSNKDLLTQHAELCSILEQHRTILGGYRNKIPSAKFEKLVDIADEHDATLRDYKTRIGQVITRGYYEVYLSAFAIVRKELKDLEHEITDILQRNAPEFHEYIFSSCRGSTYYC